jgi:hypothetical protein
MLRSIIPSAASYWLSMSITISAPALSDSASPQLG